MLAQRVTIHVPGQRLMLAAVALCTACAGSDAGYLPTDERFEPTIGVLEQPIYGTDHVGNGFYGAARIDLPGGGFCSGVLLNNYVLLTAAHCVKGGPTNIGIRYDAPDGTTLRVRRDMFFYLHDSDDIAVGGTVDSLGLGTQHFAMLRRERARKGELLAISGYGLGDGGKPNPGGAPSWLHVRVEDVNDDRMTWASREAPQGTCDGDSGSMVGKASGRFWPEGATGDHEVVWWAVSNIHVDGASGDALRFGSIDCDNKGVATDVLGWHWRIQEVVAFYPQRDDSQPTHRCEDWTNDSGDPVSYCWATSP